MDAIFPYMCSRLDPHHSGSSIIIAFISKLIHCWHFSRCFLVITTYNLCAILQSCALWALLWLWVFCSQQNRKTVMSFSFCLLIYKHVEKNKAKQKKLNVCMEEVKQGKSYFSVQGLIKPWMLQVQKFKLSLSLNKETVWG